MADTTPTDPDRGNQAALAATNQPVGGTGWNGQMALVLQGGGALGAYQVGVFRALDAAGYRPNWFAGTSIGAINAAIMAGNVPQHRLRRLEEFWRIVSSATGWSASTTGPFGPLFKAWSAWQTVTSGQPGFFQWRAVSPWFAAPTTPAALSYYSADDLRKTLGELVDLDQLNSGTVRLSLAAVKVKSGEQVYFDNRSQRIGYEHIMASAALPPAFAPIEIDDDLYWDGGIVSNTPLDVIIDQLPRRSTLCFMVDLFDAAGPIPRTIVDVEARRKDIIYASKSNRSVEAHRMNHNLRRAIMALWEALPPAKKKDHHLNELADLGCTTTMHIVRLVCRTDPYDLPSKDYEFSKPSVSAHMAAGYRDARRMLERQPWRDPVPPDVGVLIHELPTEPHPNTDMQHTDAQAHAI